MRARRATTILAAAAAAVCVGTVPLAGAQIDIGGNVGSVIGLSLTEPDGFATFPASPRARTYSETVDARVTATDAPTFLRVADAETGAARGRFRGIPQPLQAAGRRGAFQSLDTPVDPLLATFDEPTANARAAVRLRQRVAPGARRGPYRKRLLITVSAESP